MLRLLRSMLLCLLVLELFVFGLVDYCLIFLVLISLSLVVTLFFVPFVVVLHLSIVLFRLSLPLFPGSSSDCD